MSSLTWCRTNMNTEKQVIYFAMLKKNDPRTEEIKCDILATFRMSVNLSVKAALSISVNVNCM